MMHTIQQGTFTIGNDFFLCNATSSSPPPPPPLSTYLVIFIYCCCAKLLLPTRILCSKNVFILHHGISFTRACMHQQFYDELAVKNRGTTCFMCQKFQYPTGCLLLLIKDVILIYSPKLQYQYGHVQQFGVYPNMKESWFI